MYTPAHGSFRQWVFPARWDRRVPPSLAAGCWAVWGGGTERSWMSRRPPRWWCCPTGDTIRRSESIMNHAQQYHNNFLLGEVILMGLSHFDLWGMYCTVVQELVLHQHPFPNAVILLSPGGGFVSTAVSEQCHQAVASCPQLFVNSVTKQWFCIHSCLWTVSPSSGFVSTAVCEQCQQAVALCPQLFVNSVNKQWLRVHSCLWTVSPSSGFMSTAVCEQCHQAVALCPQLFVNGVTNTDYQVGSSVWQQRH